jgi:hypothetical protein
MDGDAAPLQEIVVLKEKHGAWLMLDEAHATGLYGAHRRGLAEELGSAGRIEIQMGTLGKALGASGGYICGSRRWSISSSTAPAVSSSAPRPSPPLPGPRKPAFVRPICRKAQVVAHNSGNVVAEFQSGYQSAILNRQSLPPSSR